MTTQIQSLINKVFLHCGGKMSFFIMFKNICGEEFKFYFHNARVTDYRVSIWENPFEANPVEFTLISASGLTLRAVDSNRNGEYKIWVTNPNRKHFYRSYRQWKSEVFEVLSYKEEDVVFFPVRY